MAWVKIDDQFFIKPRARKAGKDGRALFFAGLCYCAANRTDGQIVTSAVPLVASFAEVEPTVADLLVDIGLWTADQDGFQVIDFLKFNPSREQLEADAAAAAERQSRARSRRESQRDTERSDGVSPAAPLPSPSPGGQSPLPSSSDLGRLPTDLWTTMADKKLERAKAVSNPSSWRRKVMANDKADAELVARALTLVEMYEISTPQLAVHLLDGSSPSSAFRRKDPAA